MRRPGHPLISVVVPTQNRPAALQTCLAALSEQSAADRLEVLVVDDGSAAENDVAAVVAGYSCAELVRLNGAGPAAARNEGARHARGAILCFIDDDCVPQIDWAELLAEAVERGAAAAAGTTLSAGGALADASELIAHAPASGSSSSPSGLSFAPSNNLACARAVFEAVPFDESYPDAAAEDREWCARLTAAGYELRSVPAARVMHRQELTLWSFLRRQVLYGQGAYRFRTRGRRSARLEPGGFYVALVRRAFARSFAVGVLVTAAQAATTIGFMRAWATSRGELRTVTGADRSPVSGARGGGSPAPTERRPRT